MNEPSRNSPAAGVVPIRIGILVDALGPGGQIDENLLPTFELAAEMYREQGLIDRPVEFKVRAVRGLPNGSFRAVRDAYDQLVAEDCLIIFGPLITENGVPLSKHVERLAEVPILTMAGTETMLGPWVFALNNGSMADETMVISSVIVHDGHRKVAISMDAERSDVGITHIKSLIGQEYLHFARAACSEVGLKVVAELGVPVDPGEREVALADLREREPDAILHLGMGAGLYGMNKALEAIGWSVPRYTQTAFESGAREPFRSLLAGWIGLDQFDERNRTGQAFLDKFEARHGRRPAYYWPLYMYDAARVILRAVGSARPLTGEGVRNALETVKMLPAASGAPGTRIKFGKFMRQGWVGSEYLVARRMLDDGSGSVLHGTIEGLVGDA